MQSCRHWIYRSPGYIRTRPVRPNVLNRRNKPGGYFIFDHFDISTDAGWNVLIENMAKESPVYAYNYHSTETIDKVVSLLGFKIVDRYPTIRGSVFITAQKC